MTFNVQELTFVTPAALKEYAREVREKQGMAPTQGMTLFHPSTPGGHIYPYMSTGPSTSLSGSLQASTPAPAAANPPPMPPHTQPPPPAPPKVAGAADGLASPLKQNKPVPGAPGSATQTPVPAPARTPVSATTSGGTPALANANLKRKQPSSDGPSAASAEQPPLKRAPRKGGRRATGGG